MTTSDPARPVQNSLASEVLSAARYYLGNRFGLLAIAVLVLGLGAYSSWGWLVAAGIAPLLLTFAPCAAMCAFGLCTMGGKSKKTTDAASPGSVDGTDTKLPLSLAALGEKREASLASSQPAQTKPSNRKDCC
jgi:hypothetical protein